MSNPLDAWPMPLTVPSRPLLGGVEVHVLEHGGGGDGQQRSTTLVINDRVSNERDGIFWRVPGSVGYGMQRQSNP